MLRNSTWVPAITAIVLALSGCDGDSISPLSTGDLQVALSVTGTQLDGDGASVVVDELPPVLIFAGSGVDFPDLAVGSHVVALRDLAPHCTVVGQNPRAVMIADDRGARTTFDVSCGQPSVETLPGLLAAAGTYPVAQPSDQTLDQTTLTKWQDGARWTCTQTRHSVVDTPEEYATFNPNAEVVWPASMLQGATLNQATPEPVVVRRAGATLVINLLNGSQGVYRHVDEVRQSTVVQAINDIILDNSQDMPANFSYTMSSVESQEQLAFELGVNVETLTTDVKAQLEFSRDREYNRTLVRFVQGFYTVSMDLPQSLDELFHPTVTAADLAPYAGPGNPPTYISSVNYGRRFVVLIESTSSRFEMESKIRASYDAALKADVDFDAETDYLSTLKDVNVKVFALGGDQQEATAMFTGSFEDISGFLTEGATMTTGVPLSYVVRNVLDNSTVNVKVATEYDVTECQLNSYYSAFSEDAEGWTGYDNGSRKPEHMDEAACGYSTGGCIRLDDYTSGNARLYSPAAWNGDWSHLYGGTVHYLARLTESESNYVSDRPQIEIRGTAGALKLFVPNTFRTLIQQQFTPLTVNLDADVTQTSFGGAPATLRWLFNGQPATEVQIRDVLADVTGLLIRAEYMEGGDEYTWIDEFEMVGPEDEPVGGGYPPV